MRICWRVCLFVCVCVCVCIYTCIYKCFVRLQRLLLSSCVCSQSRGIFAFYTPQLWSWSHESLYLWYGRVWYIPTNPSSALHPRTPLYSTTVELITRIPLRVLLIARTPLLPCIHEPLYYPASTNSSHSARVISQRWLHESLYLWYWRVWVVHTNPFSTLYSRTPLPCIHDLLTERASHITEMIKQAHVSD